MSDIVVTRARQNDDFGVTIPTKTAWEKFIKCSN